MAATGSLASKKARTKLTALGDFPTSTLALPDVAQHGRMDAVA